MGKTVLRDMIEVFRKHLIEKQLVRPDQVQYMVHWVERFLNEEARDESAFSSVLAEEGKLPWQVRQALDSVKVFRQLFPEESVPVSEIADTTDPILEMTDRLLVRHYSRSTEKTYLGWCRRYLDYSVNSNQNPRSDDSFRAFITSLALKERVSASTQNQAFNALLFLFRYVWNTEPAGIDAVRARKGVRLPSVLSQTEVASLLSNVSGIAGLALKVIYSSGLRLHEALSLRIKDVDFEGSTITVRAGKGDKDRVTVLAEAISTDLRRHIDSLKASWENTEIPVSMPDALDRKYPNAAMEWAWQYVFPSREPAVDPRTGEIKRHHMHETSIQSMMRQALRKVGIVRQASVHTLRHSFATHLLMEGVDICEIQELLGHKSIETTRIYLHVMRNLKSPIRSPLDSLHLSGGLPCQTAPSLHKIHDIQ